MDGGNKEYIQNFSIKMSSEDTTLCPRCILLGSSLMMGFCGQSDHFWVQVNISYSEKTLQLQHQYVIRLSYSTPTF
jgi:hypothetical protein